MRVMTEQERQAWCRQRQVSVAGRFPELGREGGPRLEVNIPKVAIEIVGLTNILSSALGEDEHPQTLLWLTDWGMWSEEYDRLGIAIWEKLASGSGLPGSLSKGTSAILFEESETTEQRAFLLTATVFQWDVSLVPAHAAYVVRVNHHGELTISNADVARANAVEEALNHWKPRRSGT